MNLIYVADAPTPYRLHFMRRIARELPFHFITVFTHSASNAPWALKMPPELETDFIGQGSYGVTPAKYIWRDFVTGGKVIQKIRAAGKETIVFIGGYNDLGRLRVIRYCHRHKIPVFVFGDSNARSDHAQGAKLFIKKRLLNWVLPRLSGIFACGSLGKQFFLRYGADESKIHYSPYEPDYDQIASLPAEQIREVAKTFDLASDRRHLVYSGRFVSHKRVDLLIRAFLDIAAERPNWDLVLVGDGKVKAELQALVPTELNHRIKWLGFQKEQAVVSAVYRNADALCLPSSHEPWALVINEAAAAGLAIVASDIVGAAAELVREGINGKLFKNNDLDSLRSALLEVTDPRRIDAMRVESPKILAAWRREGDPIKGLREGFASVGWITK